MRSISIREFLEVYRSARGLGADLICYSAKLQRTEGAIQEFRNLFDTRKPENYGFASMAAVPYAHIVARILQNKHPKGTTIALAPNPKDIVSTSYSYERNDERVF